MTALRAHAIPADELCPVDGCLKTSAEDDSPGRIREWQDVGVLSSSGGSGIFNAGRSGLCGWRKQAQVRAVHSWFLLETRPVMKPAIDAGCTRDQRFSKPANCVRVDLNPV
jgi:hypothetical protein